MTIDPLADERRRQIIQRVESDGSVRVADLATALNVAEETVRRDLKLLDEQGALVRTHGGAVKIESAGESTVRAIEIPFEQRRRHRMPQKQAIAREAMNRVAGLTTIALDGSTTAWELASLLHDPQLTVVTNSLMIITLLATRPSGPAVISVGGTLERTQMMFGGMIALDALRHVQIDAFFFSCGGIDLVRGFSEPTEPSAHLKRQLLQMSERSILLADSMKFSARSSVLFGLPEDIDEVITDADAPEHVAEGFGQAGVAFTRVTGAKD